MDILTVSNENKMMNYRLTIEEIDATLLRRPGTKIALMLSSQAGEGIGISEQELFEMFDKHFKDNF